MTDMLKYPEGWMNQLPFTFIMDNPMTRADLPRRDTKTKRRMWCARNPGTCEVVPQFDGYQALVVLTVPFDSYGNTYFTEVFGAN